MRLYKLTDQELRTHDGYQWTYDKLEWSPGEWRETSGQGELAEGGWIHVYPDPLLALLMNPFHAHIPTPRLWEAEGDGELRGENGEQCGVTRLRLVRELPVPPISPEDRIRFALLCALEVCSDPRFVAWANGWLDGSDRSSESAWAAAQAGWEIADSPPPQRPPDDPTGARHAAAADTAEVAAQEADARGERAYAAAQAVWVASEAAATDGQRLDLPALARRACTDALSAWDNQPPNTQV